MPVINGVYLKDFPALPSSVTDANIIPIAISGNQIAYRTTVAGIVTDARVTSKLLTGLSVTGSTILATDTILQAFGKVQNQLNGKVTSVGLTMPAAFNVANSPITSAGTLAVTAAGVASQYIRGDGALADFPTSTGGGSSVSYYLNGSVSQGTFVGNTYYEMNKTPVIGTGTDFTINANGYIAQFITDANDPASLLIPAGNWNVEMYFSASSNGGSPSFYVEVYKYNGTTFTLLGSSSATPEGITNGTAIDIYYTSVGIPETVLTITDRLAIRVYVTHSGRTITLHTEDNHLSEIVTTFSNGLTTLNGLTKQVQYFAVGSTGTDFAIVSSVDTHTFNLPTASASNRGALSSADWTTFNSKESALTFSSPLVRTTNTISIPVATTSVNGYLSSTDWTTFNSKQNTITLTTTGTSGAATFIANTLNIPNYADGGVLSLSAIGASPNANAATITGTVLNLQPADASFGGVVTTGTQTFAGAKTFSSDLTVNTLTVGRGGGAIAFNTALGTNALYSNTTGSLNVALGYQAGFGSLGTNANTTGSNNIFIGYNSVGLSATASNRTWIGNVATTSTWLGGRLLIGSTTDSGNAAIQVTATTLLGLYASATTGIAVQGDSTGTGGTGVFGNSVNGYGGVFYNDSTTYPALEVNNNNESAGNIAVFRKAGTSVFIINSSGNISNGTYTYTLPSATGTLALTSAIPANPVGGTGTTNYLPKFTGASTIGNSILSDSGTRLTQNSGDGFVIGTSSSDSVGAGSFLALTNLLQTKWMLQQLNASFGLDWWSYDSSTWSKIMTLTAGGNLGIGTTSPTSILTVLKTITTNFGAKGNAALSLGTAGSSGEANLINFGYDAGTWQPAYIGYLTTSGAGSSNGALVFATRSSTSDVQPTEVLRIASTGAATFTANINAVTAFQFSNTNNTSGNGNLVSLLGSNCNNTSSYHLIAATGGADKFYLYGNGTYTTVSDRRLKKNISTIQDTFLDKVLKLNIVNYQWNDQTDNDALELGMIAQEVEEIIPSIVHKGRPDDNGDIYKGIQASVLPYILIKAIQELSAEIDLLKGEPIIPAQTQPNN